MLDIKKISTSGCYTAIDFETANRFRNSACAIGMIRVEKNAIVKKSVIYIRPVTNFFEFTDIHGITWESVKDCPTFAEAWPEINSFIEGSEFLAAHNASFDKKIMKTTCHEYGIHPPDLPYVCTVKLAREVWKLFPTKLPDVCRFLNLTLDHHNPLSDAEACANIIIGAVNFHKDQAKNA